MSDTKPLLWLPGNRPYNPAAPPTEPIATIGAVWDPFVSRHVDIEVTPESIARALRGDFPLAKKQALAKRILKNDAAFAGSYRNLVLGVAGIGWESLARDKKLRREQRIAEKVRDYVQQQFENLPVEQLVKHLADGEYSPGAWAENQWDLLTKALTGWEFLDGVRQHWDPRESRYRVLTKDQPSRGEELAPNMWAIHTSHLFPGHPLEAGLWSDVIWQYCWKHFSIADWIAFNAVYGKPWRLAFIRDPKDRESVIKALRSLGANAAAAFPEGTEVRLERGISDNSGDIFEKLASRADDEVSILLTGHNLTTKSQPGAGTLAGNGAMKVHEKILRNVAMGIMATVWRDIVMPMVTFRFGYEVANEYTSPTSTFKLKYEPPPDRRANARTYALVNKELERSGKTIDPQQLVEEFGVGIVDLPEPAQPPADDDDPPPSPADESGDEEDELEAAASRRRSGRELAAAAATPLTTYQAIEELGAAVGQRGFAEIAAGLEASIGAAGDDYAELAAAIWEDYGNHSGAKRKLAAALRDTMLTAHVAGRGDAHAGD